MTSSILVCVTAQKECARLIRRGHSLAQERGQQLHVLHVSQARSAQTSLKEEADTLNKLFELAHEADADMEVLYENDVQKAICRYAGDIDAGVVVVGYGKSGSMNNLPLLLPACEIVVCEQD